MVLFFLFRSKYRLKPYRPFGIVSNVLDQTSYWCDHIAGIVVAICKLKNVPSDQQQLYFGEAVHVDEIVTLYEEVAGSDEDALQDKLLWLFVSIHEEDIYANSNTKERYKLFRLIYVLLKHFCKYDAKHFKAYLFKENFEFFYERARDKFDQKKPFDKIQYADTPTYPLDNTCEEFLDPKIMELFNQLQPEQYTLYLSIWSDIFAIMKAKHPDTAHIPVKNMELLHAFFNMKDGRTNVFAHELDDYFASAIAQESSTKMEFSDARRHQFETLLYALESAQGPGLLLYKADKLMQRYHKIVLVDYVQRNKEKFDRAQKIDTEHIDTLKEVSLAIQRVRIHMGYEFPMLLHHDTKKVADKERLRLYYNNMMKRMIETIKFNFATLGKLGNYFKRHPNVQNRHDTKIFRAGVGLLLYCRTFAVNVSNDPGGFIIGTFKSFIEGFEEKFTEQLDKQQKNKKVVEPFVGSIIRGVKKIFKPIFSLVDMLIAFFKVLLMITGILTNPVKIIMLPIAFMFVITTLILCLIEGAMFHVFTSILLCVFTLVYIVIATVIMILLTTLYYCIGMLDVEAFNAFFAVYMYSLFISAEIDIRDWHMKPSFEQGNQTYRGLFGAFKACDTNYNHGFFMCERISPYVPVFSHQANIFRIMNGIPLRGQTEPKIFRPPSDFHDMPKGKKYRMIREADRSKRLYYKNVEKNSAKFNEITESVCSNIDAMQLSSGNRGSVERMCYISYCRNGKFKPFCASLSTDSDGQSHTQDKIEKYLHVTSYISMLCVLIALIYVGYDQTGSQDIMKIFSVPKNLIYQPVKKVV